MQSTTAHLNIAEIKKDTLIMKDGSVRAVILVSSVNFALKSEDEQKALIAGYVTMLNMLEYPLQILIQSRKMNIDDYLNDLEERARVQTNELLKIHTEDYLSYVREIITIGNIMSKKFYIIVSYDPGGHSRPSFIKRAIGVFTPTKVIRLKESVFAKYRAYLDKRIDNVLSGLSNLSLRAVRLDTESLIELFYSTFNPDVSQAQKLGKIEELQVER
ncbi:MAG: TraC family protein [Candidatus Jacksonbacteria bacterium]